MSKAKELLGGAIKVVTDLFKPEKMEAPAAAEPEKVAPTPDDEAARRGKEKDMVRRARSGRASTALTGGSKLG